ncbi:FecCD family ABC transporter permease [Paenibacillus lutrae]|uniref:Iron chelate uptake ABC transporter family permease subunit n=1 Tax=Paenibacillus lutrae TaxID=2078573 RepID=A0A7X3FL18_9BACL|nr:iron ABC transporter permease [Paenibacillus lutrae]MVP01685.1 iron chelate uptake ABC transporter family permease subunit [Paenibacillus lutrae]
MSRYKHIRLNKPPISFVLDKRALLVTGVLLAILILLMLVATGTGEIKMSPLQVLKTLLGMGAPQDELIIHTFRLPRVLVAVLVGAALAMSGAIMQGVSRNPLASPDIIGITDGAGVFVVAFIVATAGTGSAFLAKAEYLPLAAFIGASLTALVIMALAWKNGLPPVRLVLIGIGIAASLAALNTMLILMAPPVLTTQAITWKVGSVYGSNWSHVSTLAAWIAVLTPILAYMMRGMNVQALGDSVATGVGSRVNRQRVVLILLSTALAGSAVAFGGGIAFVGLIAPHMARRLVGSAYGALLPASALFGALVVLLSDYIGRTAFPPHDYPAGIFTACVGAPYFIYLLYKSRNM